MKNRYTVAAVVRSWKNDKVVEQVKFLLASAKINYAVVAINADVQSKGEPLGAYTSNLLRTAFGPDLPEKLIIHPVFNWGKNPGSAAALNEAASELFYRLGRLPNKYDIILNLSVESKTKHEIIDRAIDLFDQNKNLAVVGVKREILIGQSKEEKDLVEKIKNNLQYLVPQNTIAFWRADLLRLAGGFRTECDFSNMTVAIDGQEAPAAGMEDFPSLCFLALVGYNWQLIEDNPMIWDLRGMKEDEAKWQQNTKKMKRQDKVMEIWSRKYFSKTLDEMMAILKNAQMPQN